MTKVILASASPRRLELLRALIDDFEVVPADVAEELTTDGHADALRLAERKADAIASTNPNAIVIGSDTVVHDGTATYGKPMTPREATAMLRALAGRIHVVTTALAVAHDGQLECAALDAVVHMAPLTAPQILDYVATGRPMDKAGAYAIQDADVPTVASLDGCYCCVMGLPLWLLRGMLERAGVVAHDPGQRISRCQVCPARPG